MLLPFRREDILIWKCLLLSKVTKNIIYNVLGQIATVLLGFVATRQIYSLLPADVLGLYYFSFALNLVLTQSLLGGIGALIIREVANGRVSDPAYVKRISQTTTLLFWAFYIVIVVVVFAITPWLVNNWIQLTEIDPATAILTLRILLFGILSAVLTTLYRCLLRGVEDMAFTNLTLVIATVVRQVGIVVFLHVGAGILLTAAWISISFWMIPVALFVRSKYFFTWAELVQPSWHIDVVRRNLNDAAKLGASTVLDMVQYQADKIIISALMPISMLGMYSFVYSFVTRAGSFRAAVGSAALPAMSRIHAANRNAGVLRLYDKLETLMAYGTLPLFALLAFAMYPITSFVFSPSDAQHLLLPGILLVIGVYLLGVSSPARELSVATGYPGLITSTSLLSVVISVPAAVVLIRAMGLEGAGYASLIMGIVFALYFVPQVYTKCMGRPVRTWFAFLGRILLLITLTYGAAGLLIVQEGLFSIGALAVGYTIASIGFMVGSYFLVEREIIEDLITSFRRLLSRLRRSTDPTASSGDVT